MTKVRGKAELRVHSVSVGLEIGDEILAVTTSVALELCGLRLSLPDAEEVGDGSVAGDVVSTTTELDDV